MPRATPRKTIEVGKMLRMVNAFLDAEHTKADEREGVICLLEAVLFETGNYRGFRYIAGTPTLEDVEGAGSRRFYYPSEKIREDYEADLSNSNRVRV